MRKSGGETNPAGSSATSAGANGVQFVFPQAGPLKPPEPPATYTTQQLETTYAQAAKLWPEITRHSCANALASHFADGDPSKAIVLIQFYRDASEGYVTSVFKRNGSLLALRGAMNYGGISCYMDSLLVAMFSRMENFEPLLYKKRYEDRATDQLATWLRLFVNLLRNGERITEDIVEALLATAVAAGWTAGSNPLSQQDAADFFVFITEKLKMPLLALKVDIAHAGKEVEEYDHKLIREQLLYLPVPGGEQDPPILLEECLEVYFSNTINVSRHLARPSVPLNGSLTGSITDSPASIATRSSIDAYSQPPRRRSYSIMSLTSGPRRPTRTDLGDSVSPMPAIPPLPGGVSSDTASPGLGNGDGSTSSGIGPSSSQSGLAGTSGFSPAVTSSSTTTTPSMPSVPFFKQRLHMSPPSGLGDYFDPLDESENAMMSSPEPQSRNSSEHPQERLQEHPQEHPTPPPHAGSLPSYHQLFGFNDDKQADAQIRDIKQSLWTSDNEMTLPAWMFLQLLPFYADISPNKDSSLENLEADEVANHFRQTRPVLGFCLKRYYVDEHGHPHRNNRIVVVPEEINMPSFVADDSDQKHAFGNFKLVLESALFHRGNSINSGHYCALLAEDVAKHRKTSATHGLSGDPSRNSIIGSLPASSSDSIPVAGPGAFGTAQHNVHHHHASGSSGSANFSASSNSSNTHYRSSSKRKKWYLFDDLQPGGDRIKEVQFSSTFEKESPYMLFYRMVALEDESPNLNFVNPIFSTPSLISTQPSSSPSSGPGALLPPAHIPMPSSHPPQSPSIAPGAVPSEVQSRSTSRAPSPEPGKDKKKKSKFFRRHKDKERDRHKDYASKYREEKCTIM